MATGKPQMKQKKTGGLYERRRAERGDTEIPRTSDDHTVDSSGEDVEVKICRGPAEGPGNVPVVPFGWKLRWSHDPQWDEWARLSEVRVHPSHPTNIADASGSGRRRKYRVRLQSAAESLTFVELRAFTLVATSS